MDYKETIVLIIAIYGVGLSTYLAWKKRQEYIPKIKISTSENFLLKVHPISSTEPVINVEAKNLGQKRVVFSEDGYLLPNRKKLASFLPTTISFPYQLEIEKSVQINMNS